MMVPLEVVYIPPKDTISPVIKVNNSYRFFHHDINCIKEVI